MPFLEDLGGAAKSVLSGLANVSVDVREGRAREKQAQQKYQLFQDQQLMKAIAGDKSLLALDPVATRYDRIVGSPGAHEEVLLQEAQRRNLLGAPPPAGATEITQGSATLPSGTVVPFDQRTPMTAKPAPSLAPGQSVSGKADGVTYTRRGPKTPTVSEQGAMDFGKALQGGLDAGMQAGIFASPDDPAAVQFVAKQVGAQAQRAGQVIPERWQKVLNAKTDRALASALAGAKAEATKAVELKYEKSISAARETGTRLARLNLPISEEEYRSGNIIAASKLGGTTFGRNLSDDDVATADVQGHVLLQQPDGTFIGLPPEAVPAGLTALTPDELRTKRLAQAVAARTTTQQQNAQIILSALDQVDSLKAFELLQPAAPQGAGLGGKLLGAAKTELSGLTTGQATVWAARRSPDGAEREKAIALINLSTLATSVVKALGDVGAISEADKSVFLTRLGRIAAGRASREEGESQKEQLRQLMHLVTSASGQLVKGSAEAQALQQATHEVLTTSAAPGVAAGGNADPRLETARRFAEEIAAGRMTTEQAVQQLQGGSAAAPTVGGQ